MWIERRAERERCTWPATAMQRETRRPDSGMRVVIMPNLEVLMKVDRSLILVAVSGSSRFFSLYLENMSVHCTEAMVCGIGTYGSAGFEPVSAFEYDMAAVLARFPDGIRR